MNNNFKGLAHIGIHTEDVLTARQFYIENLGFELLCEVKVPKPNNEYLNISMVNLNGMILELVQPSEKKAIRNGDGRIEHIAVEVKDLKQIVGKLRLKGIRFDTEEPIKVSQLFNGVQVIFLRGPSGERIELFEYLD